MSSGPGWLHREDLLRGERRTGRNGPGLARRRGRRAGRRGRGGVRALGDPCSAQDLLQDGHLPGVQAPDPGRDGRPGPPRPRRGPAGRGTRQGLQEQALVGLRLPGRQEGHPGRVVLEPDPAPGEQADGSRSRGASGTAPTAVRRPPDSRSPRACARSWHGGSRCMRPAARADRVVRTAVPGTGPPRAHIREEQGGRRLLSTRPRSTRATPRARWRSPPRARRRGRLRVARRQTAPRRVARRPRHRRPRRRRRRRARCRR